MTTYTATTNADVLRLLATAANNDVIELASGNYDGLNLTGINKTGTVTITSQDEDNPALLTGLLINNSAGLKLTNLEVFTDVDSKLLVTSSQRITLDELDVHGTLNGSSHDDGQGLFVRNSSNVTVSNSHFHELTDALVPLNLTNTLITGNTFDLIRDNGVAGGGNSQIVISNNFFTNFDHEGLIHPDAIQIWTTNTTTRATDITVTGNVIDRGEGAVIQGIFINDETGRQPYQNLSVTDNVVVGASYHGITVMGAINTSITGNVVLGASDQKSWIAVQNVNYALVEDNVATSFNFNSAAIRSRGNVLATDFALSDDGSYSTWIADNGLGNPATADMAGNTAAVAIDNVDLIGFRDGPSRNGVTYDFAWLEIKGTDGNDRLSAASAGNYNILGYGGNDVLSGNSAGVANRLEGGDGDDSYGIYQAIDQVVEAAGAGNDTVYAYVSYTLAANVENLRAAAAGLTLFGNELNNSMVAATGGSVLNGMGGNDSMLGNTGTDRLFGGAGVDRLTGNDGNDYMDGGSENDTLIGGNGYDTMIGGTGDDILEGGVAADLLIGGAGADAFLFRSGDFYGGIGVSRDTIRDFSSAAGDRIWLTQVDANANTAANDAFRFIGNQAFHGVAGELRYAADGDGINVYGDTNGDKVADLAIHLTGLTAITGSSFFL